MADLDGDVRTLIKDVSQLERQIYNLRITIQGEDGRGGLVGSISALSQQQASDGRVLRVSIWLPTMISIFSLIVSVVALVAALSGT